MGCSSKPITESSNNTTKEFELGSPFQIQLKGDASSANNLILENKAFTAVRFVDKSITTEAGEKVYTFDFVAENEGEDDIVIVYGDGPEAQKIFKLHVISGTIGRIESE